jgi:urease accessory protein
MKPIKEIRDTSTRSGTQLLRCVTFFISENKLLNKYQEAIKNKQASGVYPIALGVISSVLDTSRRNSGLMMLYSFTISLVGAALRLGILQHYDVKEMFMI